MITTSGLYIQTWLKMLNVTQLAVSLTSPTLKCALFTDSVTPNFSTDTAWNVAPYHEGEAAGAGYTHGGNLIPAPTLTESPAGTLRWHADPITWTTVTVTGVRGTLIYADELNDNALALINFGAEYSCQSGTFTITPASTGLAAFDITP